MIPKVVTFGLVVGQVCILYGCQPETVGQVEVTPIIARPDVVAATPQPRTEPGKTAPPSAPSSRRTVAQVVRVIDGDTIEVRIEDRTYKVRYIGMDTPETKHPQKPVEWMGEEAAVENEKLVGGRSVELEKDVSETDRYGRLLRYVWVGDMMVNAELVRLGYAQASSYPPDVRYAELFRELQREAREAQRGLWGPKPVVGVVGTRVVVATVTEVEGQGSGCDCSCNRYNCKDFGSHADAQGCYELCKAAGRGDVHRLDGDGVACEEWR